MRDVFCCTIAQHAHRARIYLDGELDGSTAWLLDDRLRPLARTGGDLTIDLSGLTFLGVAGLQALARLHEQSTAAGGSVRLAGASRAMHRLIELSGLQHRLADL